MGRTRTAGLALLLLAASGAQAAQPTPYRALGRGEVPNLVFGAVKDWAVELEEVRALSKFIFEGGRRSFSLGAWNMRVDASGRQFQRTLSSRNGRLLGVGLGRTDEGWSAEAVLGLRDGRFLNQSFNLAYKLRY